MSDRSYNILLVVAATFVTVAWIMADRALLAAIWGAIAATYVDDLLDRPRGRR